MTSEKFRAVACTVEPSGSLLLRLIEGIIGVRSFSVVLRVWFHDDH